MSEEEKRPEWIWCLVGNVVKERSYGPDHEVRRGTKRFQPGTKVYCYPGQWGDGYENIYVIGRPRNGRGLIRLVTRREHIENFRLQRVYNPRVIDMMTPRDEEDRNGVVLRCWGDTDRDRMAIKEMLAWLNLDEEQERRRHVVTMFRSLTLETEIEGCPEGGATLRIERRDRSDSKYGGAWLGTYALGTGPECDAGVLDSYGAWPEGAHLARGASMHYSDDLPLGLGDAGIHLWEDHVEAPANYGGPSYSWRLTVGDGRREFGCSGRNARPGTLPSVCRLLAAWGLPAIWDSALDAPCLHLTNPTAAEPRRLDLGRPFLSDGIL